MRACHQITTIIKYTSMCLDLLLKLAIRFLMSCYTYRLYLIIRSSRRRKVQITKDKSFWSYWQRERKMCRKSGNEWEHFLVIAFIEINIHYIFFFFSSIKFSSSRFCPAHLPSNEMWIGMSTSLSTLIFDWGAVNDKEKE